MGHGGGQLAASGRAHRREQDRVLDAEQAGQRGFDNGHARPPLQDSETPTRY